MNVRDWAFKFSAASDESQANPMITQLVVSTRSSAGIAAGQTWVFAGAFGALIIFGILAIGASGMGEEKAAIPSLLLGLSALLATFSLVASLSRGLKPAASSAGLAWFFLAVCLGAVLGNQTLGAPANGLESWFMGIPSIWAWIMMLWVLDVFLIWFLSYEMNLATSSPIVVSALKTPIQTPIRDTKIQEPELIRLLWTVDITAGVITVVSRIFGSQTTRSST